MAPEGGRVAVAWWRGVGVAADWHFGGACGTQIDSWRACVARFAAHFACVIWRRDTCISIIDGVTFGWAFGITHFGIPAWHSWHSLHSLTCVFGF